MSDYSPYQKGVIKRFYEHRDTLALQKLSETVSNLYLETNATKIKRAWSSAEKQMVAAGVAQKQAAKISAERDLDALARVVAELT